MAPFAAELESNSPPAIVRIRNKVWKNYFYPALILNLYDYRETFSLVSPNRLAKDIFLQLFFNHVITEKNREKRILSRNIAFQKIYFNLPDFVQLGGV